MEISFKVHGLEEWVNKLEALKGIENDPRIDRALGRGAARMQAAVKLLTPVGAPEWGGTGNLRNKIFLDHPKSMEWHITTNVEYAAFVEYGTGKLGDPAVPHTSKEHWTYYNTFAKQFITTHGQKPVHMFAKGFSTTHVKVFDIVQKEVKEIIKNA
jgi:hypothetical protein